MQQGLRYSALFTPQVKWEHEATLAHDCANQRRCCTLCRAAAVFKQSLDLSPVTDAAATLGAVPNTEDLRTVRGTLNIARCVTCC